MHIFGIDWVGINAENGRKLLLSIVFIAVIVGLRMALRAIVGSMIGRADDATTQTKFWTRQGISLLAAVILILGLLSIWFNDPTRLATAFGLMSAGLAFALQQVVTSVAGYFVVLRGNTFTVGDRISMGGVRGDVMRLGFIQTTIMEMGQPPGMQGAEPSMWVRSRQFTGPHCHGQQREGFCRACLQLQPRFPVHLGRDGRPDHLQGRPEHRRNHLAGCGAATRGRSEFGRLGGQGEPADPVRDRAHRLGSPGFSTASPITGSS